MAASARPRRPGVASSAARADAVGVNSAAASAATTLAAMGEGMPAITKASVPTAKAPAARTSSARRVRSVVSCATGLSSLFSGRATGEGCSCCMIAIIAANAKTAIMPSW